jgi:Zn-dependent peptidase ImmA (M78 family)/transcriptional regulator with XRE-family HTH domain
MTNKSEVGESIIKGTQLQKARELLQLSHAEVASALNVEQQVVFDWEEDRLHPSLKQLEKLAELYGRGIDYFLKVTPVSPSEIEFRGKPGQTVSDLPIQAKTVLARFDELCRTALEVEGLLNKKREVRLPRFDESVPPKVVADNLRKRLGANDKPLPNLRERLEIEGVRIFELLVPEDAFSGFSFWHSDYGPCVLLNASDLKGRRNFTLAHELAHLLYGHESALCYIPLKLSDVREDIEFKTTQFAIELLLPETGVKEDFRRKELSRTPAETELGQMAGKWGVSIQALGYRLENFDLIAGGYTDTLFEFKPKFFRRPRTPKWQRQMGKQFVEATFEAYDKGLLSTGKVASALGITVREAVKEIETRSIRQG